MKKLLLISYHYPPISNMATHRMVRFIKNFGRFGWEPIVLTLSQDVFYPYKDESLNRLEILENITVHRTKTFSLQGIYHRIKKVPKGLPDNLETQKLGGKELFIRKTLRLAKKWLILPDDSIFWLPFAVLEGLKIIKSQNTDLIFTSSPPHSIHLIGYILKQITHKPWVCEFRDVWVGSPYNIFPSALHKIVNEFLNRLVIYSADRIVVTSRECGKKILKHCPKVSEDRISLVYNSFDEDNLKFSPSKNKSSIFIISYTGKIYGSRSISSFLKAYKNFIVKKNLSPIDTKFRFIGVCDEVQIESEIRHLDLSEYVSMEGYISHSLIPSILQDSSVLLLVKSPDDFIHIPGKLFEYMVANRPILALSNPSEVTDIIKENSLGISVDPNSTEEIEKGLEKLYYQWVNGISNPYDPQVSKFASISQTNTLCKVFESILR
jgi:hypothetical protein